MPFMSTQSVEITNESLLQVVAQMPRREFARFLSEVGWLRGKTPQPQAKEAVRLIQKVNETVLSEAEQKRFNELVEKRRAENIGVHELNELIVLINKSEELNVKRLKYLANLARIRHKTLREVMQELEISPPPTI